MCQLSSETNKPFLTSCQSPPTITGPEQQRAAAVEQTACWGVRLMNIVLIGHCIHSCFCPSFFVSVHQIHKSLCIINAISLPKFPRFWQSVPSSLRSMGLLMGSTDCRGSRQISNVSGTQRAHQRQLFALSLEYFNPLRNKWQFTTLNLKYQSYIVGHLAHLHQQQQPHAALEGCWARNWELFVCAGRNSAPRRALTLQRKCTSRTSTVWVPYVSCTSGSCPILC